MNKDKIKDVLLSIVLTELEKDYKEIDTDLINENVDFILEIDNKKRLSQEEIKEKVNKIPFKR